MSAPVRMDLTVMWLPVTARATLPQTSVDATTMGARGCAISPGAQPVSALGPISKTVVVGKILEIFDSQRATLTSAIRAP